MGMAASQARYLALVARKSNCEYEGQQINQARLLLSNQSANLFNQMLGLTVPVPPSTQDFTKIQYSYTDGNNASTIDSWKQLANDPEYNYIVSSHYYTETYTGSVKKMTDPQVQVSSPNGVSTSLGNWGQIEAAYNAMTAAQSVRDSAYDTWQSTKNSQERIISGIKNSAQVNNGYQVFQQSLNERTASTIMAGYTQYLFKNVTNNSSNDIYNYNIKNFNNADGVDPAYIDTLQSGIQPAINAAQPFADDINNNFATISDADAIADARQVLEQALPAAENALAIANEAADAAAIAAAQTAYDTIMNALNDWDTNPPADKTAAQTLANTVMSQVNAANTAITSTVISDAKTNMQTEVTNAQSILQGIKDQIELGITSIDAVNANILDYNTTHSITPTVYIQNIDDLVDFSNVPPYNDIQKEVLNAYSLSVEDLNGTPTGKTDIVLTKDVESLYSNLPTTAGASTWPIGGYPLAGVATTNAAYLAQIAAAQTLIDADYNTYEAAETIYQNALNAYNALNRPTYIGNSELTLLGTLTQDQSTELLQVVKDMKAEGITSHLLDCFNEDGSYKGGVYSFRLNGNTYYTTFEDLADAYASNHLSNNLIDAQYKMPYYNATYIQKRIDQTGKALLETDGEGRFSSVRFENDSVTYTLKTETITDDEAYQDAMNQYYYENAVYDKTVQEINAQTSIIQQEDQQLELRLKQLDTEQNALKTEMDAVSKIVKDNVEDTFKTFGG